MVMDIDSGQEDKRRREKRHKKVREFPVGKRSRGTLGEKERNAGLYFPPLPRQRSCGPKKQYHAK